MKLKVVDDYINNSISWQKEMTILRRILLDCGLEERFKWKVPTYCLKDKNLVIIGKYKNYIALSFLCGVLLRDHEQLLHSPGENSQYVRFFKFKSVKEILNIEKTIKAYLYETIAIENQGIVLKKTNSKLCLVDELLIQFKNNKDFENSFRALSNGRQRGYNIYFSGAKQSSTRTKRIEKVKPRILNGYGLNDCTCGMTKRKPNCDGSHKNVNKNNIH